VFQTSCFNRLWKASRVHHSEADNKIPSSLLGPGIRPPDHNQSTTVRTGVIKPWMLGKSLNSWDDLRITRPGYDIHTLRHGPAMAQSKVRGFFPIDSMAHLSSSLHSYVNVYQRLLRCSYGFPMVFPWFSHWNLHFPEGLLLAVPASHAAKTPHLGQRSHGSPKGGGVLCGLTFHRKVITVARSHNVRPPSDVSWFISRINYSYLRTINHSDIGVMFTNLDIERGPHIAGHPNDHGTQRFTDKKVPGTASNICGLELRWWYFFLRWWYFGWSIFDLDRSFLWNFN